MSKFIEFRPVHTETITKRWEVVSKLGGDPLGVVKWFGRWRKYAFFPLAECVFEEVCLRDLAEFCETSTREHRASKHE